MTRSTSTRGGDVIRIITASPASSGTTDSPTRSASPSTTSRSRHPRSPGDQRRRLSRRLRPDPGRMVGRQRAVGRCGEASPRCSVSSTPTRQALDLGIAAARPGNHIGDIGAGPDFVEARLFGGPSSTSPWIGRDMLNSAVPTTGIPERATSSSPGTASRLSRWSTSDVRRRASSTTTGRCDADGKLSCYFEHTVRSPIRPRV